MRNSGQPCRQESQLYLVQETLLELTFQRGDVPKMILIKKARLELLLNLAITIVFLGVALVVMDSFINTNRNIPVPSKAFEPFYFFFAIFIIFPMIMVISGIRRACFTLWTFDRSHQQILKTTTNLLGRTHRYIFPFNEVKSISVEEDHDPPHTLTELYMLLKSGKKITLSSSYTFKESEKVDNFRYHQIIADKMRHQVGL